MSTFKVGDRVVDKTRSNLKTHNEYELDVLSGTVVELYPNEPDNISVKWDASWQSPKTQKLSTSALITEEEANLILKTLEDEYEVWAGPIREKMKKAGELILEAEGLALKEKKHLIHLHELSGGLIHAMDEVGWSTSSLSC